MKQHQKKEFSPFEINYITEHCECYSNEQMACALKMSVYHVKECKKELGLFMNKVRSKGTIIEDANGMFNVNASIDWLT